MSKRKSIQKIKDSLTFPLRSITLFYVDRWGLSSLATERYDYVRTEVAGYLQISKRNLSILSGFRIIYFLLEAIKFEK